MIVMNNEEQQNGKQPTEPATEPVTEATETEEIVQTDEEGNPGTMKDTSKKLRDELKQCQEEKQKYLTDLQRAKADFVNMRKRDEERMAETVKFANESLIAKLVPVLDSFDMAMANKEAWEKVDKDWRTGVMYIYSQLVGALKNNNLEPISPLGEAFDPMRDEAVEFEKVTDEKQHNIVTKVIQKGYTLNGKIIKAPKVKVGEFAKQ